jgi:hypothetical protein
MSDLARAVLLPDVFPIGGSLLKTLALYWDDLILIDYQERLLDEPEYEEPVDAARMELENAGIIAVQQRRLAIEPLPTWLRADVSALVDRIRPHLSEDNRTGFENALAGPLGDDPIALPMMISRAITNEMRPPPAKPEDDPVYWPLLKAATRVFLESQFGLARDHYLRRVEDTCDLAFTNGWGPVAGSAVAGVAAALGPEAESLPVREVSLLSVAADAFAIGSDTEVDAIVRVREKHGRSLRRFRASLIDLSGSLAAEGPPVRRLNQARDTFLDRVMPALGDLEAILSQSKIKFTISSLLGTATLALQPIQPAAAVTSGVRISADVINYRFARSELVNQHPFGYLHHISNELGAKSAEDAGRLLVETQRDPSAVFERLFFERRALEAALQRVWGWNPKTG